MTTQSVLPDGSTRSAWCSESRIDYSVYQLNSGAPVPFLVIDDCVEMWLDVLTASGIQQPSPFI